MSGIGARALEQCDIARFLIDHGTDGEMPVSVCENLTLDNERTVTSTLDGILSQEFDMLCVMVVGADQTETPKRQKQIVFLKKQKSLEI